MVISGVTLSGVNVFDTSPITTGLVLYYNPANSASYSGSGTTVTDLSGNGLRERYVV